MITAPGNRLSAKKLLIIGLGDSETFSPQRMQLVGKIVYREASDLRVAHPYFAPTVLDGGVTKFATGDVAREAIGGFLRAAATNQVLQDANATAGSKVTGLTFLAGAKNVSSTRDGIEKAISQTSMK